MVQPFCVIKEQRSLVSQEAEIFQGINFCLKCLIENGWGHLDDQFELKTSKGEGPVSENVSSLYERVCLDPIKYVGFKTGNASLVR